MYLRVVLMLNIAFVPDIMLKCIFLPDRVKIKRFNENHQQGEMVFPDSWFIENIKCCFKCSPDQNNFQHQFEACLISSTRDEINFRHRFEMCPISSSADYNNFQHWFETCPVSSAAGRNNFHHKFQTCPVSSTADKINFRHRFANCSLSQNVFRFCGILWLLIAALAKKPMEKIHIEWILYWKIWSFILSARPCKHAHISSTLIKQ